MEVPIFVFLGTTLCSTSSLRALLATSHAGPNQPLVSWSWRTPTVDAALTEFIKSSENGRAGSPGHLMLQGIWASDTYLGYLPRSEENTHLARECRPSGTPRSHKIGINIGSSCFPSILGDHIKKITCLNS